MKSILFFIFLIGSQPLWANNTKEVIDELSEIIRDLNISIKNIRSILTPLKKECEIFFYSKFCEFQKNGIKVDVESLYKLNCGLNKNLQLKIDEILENCTIKNMLLEEIESITKDYPQCVQDPFGNIIDKESVIFYILDKIRVKIRNGLPIGNKDSFAVRFNEEVTPLFNFESYIEKLRVMKNAKESIYSEDLEYYGDLSGILMGELLINKKKKGVDVKQIIDGFAMIQGTKNNPLLRENTLILYNNFLAAGIPIYGYSGDGKLTTNSFEIKKPLEFLKRRHEKFVIIDSQNSTKKNLNSTILIMGGQNKGDGYNGIARKSFIDVDIMVKNDNTQSTIHDARRAFLANLEQERKRYIDSDGNDTRIELNPYDPIKEKEKYDSFLKKHYKPYKGFQLHQIKDDQFFSEEWKKTLHDYDKALQDKNDKYTPNPHIDKLAESLLSIDSVSSKGPIKTEQTRLIHNRPKHKDHQILDAYVALIDSEPEGGEIILENAYFLPSRFVRKAIYRALDRGVKVSIVTNHPSVNHDLKVLTQIGRLYYHKLIRKGAKIFEVMGDPVDSSRGNELEAKDTLHAKVALFRKQNVSLISSYNLDFVSERKNSEAAFLVKSPEFMHELAQQMDDTMVHFSRQIDQKRSLEFKRIYRNFTGHISSPVRKHL